MLTFLNMGLLGGLGLVSLPIIIYLLQQHRVKEIEWAAMRFIAEIVEEQKKQIQLEDLLLLLLRCLMVICLALALARPALKSSGALNFLGASGDAVIVIDDSFSMATRQGAQDRFETAKERAQTVINELPGSYGISLLLASELPETMVGNFSTDHELLKQTIKELKVGSLAGAPHRSVADTIELLKQSKQGARTIFYISDFQSEEWKSLPDATKKQIKDTTAESQIIFVPVGDATTQNLSVADVELIQGAVREGQKAYFVGIVENHGSEQAENVAIDFLLDGQVVESKTISVAPNQNARVFFSTIVHNEGYHRAVIKIAQDANEKDNQGFLAFKAYSQLKVLAVLDQEPDDSQANSTDFLELGLNPFPERSDDPRALFQFNHVSMQNFALENLADYEMVFVSDVAGFTLGEVTHLENFLKDGGGVMMFLGPTVSVEAYNANLYRDGKGIFPWPLHTEKLNPAEKDKQDPLPMKYKGDLHPMWEHLVVGKKNYMADVNFYQGLGFTATEQEGAISLAAAISPETKKEYSFISAFKYGRGQLLVVNTTADLKWNNFVARPAFVGFIQNAAKFLRKPKVGERTYTVGHSYEREVSWQRSQATYELQDPNGEKRSASVLEENEVFRVDFGMLTDAGFYKLSNDKDATETKVLSVNINRKESKIETLGAQELKNLFDDMGVITDPSADLTESLAGVKATPDFAQWLLALALLFWIAENLLAHKMARRGQ